MERMAAKNYYELLGVPQNASMEQIQKVYVDLTRIFSPDSEFYADIIDDPPRPEHIAMFDAITTAFTVLSDAGRRADYDRSLISNLPGWDNAEPATAAQSDAHHEDGRLGFDRSGAPHSLLEAHQPVAAEEKTALLPTIVACSGVLLFAAAIAAWVLR